ncbi:hypothetical protein CONPUDRAFT_65507, partial [Coniophora puteana RWD-64-598 SS2]
DEFFDSSYEGLIELASMLGDAKPRSTPADVVASLPSAKYQDWANADSETRCPICLDDYQPSDSVSRLPDCTHWLHKPCLEVSIHISKLLEILTLNVGFRSNGWVPRTLVQSVARKSKTLRGLVSTQLLAYQAVPQVLAGWQILRTTLTLAPHLLLSHRRSLIASLAVSHTSPHRQPLQDQV